MFALLFDRKSLTMTLLALGGVGLLLFVSGFVLGSYLNGGLVHLGVVSQEASLAAPAAASSRFTSSAERRISRRTAAPAPAASVTVEEAPAEQEPGASTGDQIPAEMMDGAEPPADWVPLEDGGVWPGDGPGEGAEEEPVRGEAAEGALIVEPGAAQVADTAATVSPAVQTAAARPQGFYYVQLGTYSREELALEKQAEAESRIAARETGDVAPFLTQVTDRGGREAFAVRVGPFPTRGAAREAAAGFGRASIVWSPAGRAL
jgi:septal ring-binding cell division protein DamX